MTTLYIYVKRNGYLPFLFLLLTSPLFSQNKTYKFSHQQMGTIFSIYIKSNDSLKAQSASQKAFRKLDELNLILSDYREDSEINQLCQTAGTNQAIKVSKELFEILETSKIAAQKSKGAFDVSIGPLTQLWRRMKRQKQLPSTTQIEEAIQKTGIQNIILNAENQTVKLIIKGMRIDFGGIGKGFAEDKMMEILKNEGIDSAMIEGGGNIIVSNGDWEIVINNEKRILNNCGISTSGDLYQFIEIEGKKYSHIVNPKTGLGFTESKQVSVIAHDSTTADWLSTAVYLMNEKEGKKLAKKMKVEVFMAR